MNGRGVRSCVLLGAAIAVAAAPVSGAEDASAHERPNVVLVSLDTLRADHLGLYGYGRPTSPNIDQLGRSAVRFTQCYVPLARTLQSWTCILTGTWPHTHGLRTTWTSSPHIDMPLPTLCRELRKKGYRSCVFSDWAGSDFGKVDYGFDATEVSPEAWRLSSWIGQATCRAHPLLVSFGDNWLWYKLFPEMKGLPVSPSP